MGREVQLGPDKPLVPVQVAARPHGVVDVSQGLATREPRGAASTPGKPQERSMLRGISSCGTTLFGV